MTRKTDSEREAEDARVLAALTARPQATRAVARRAYLPTVPGCRTVLRRLERRGLVVSGGTGAELYWRLP